MALAVGVDGTKGGWLFVTTRDSAFEGAAFYERFADGIQRYPEVTIAVDIPIGLPKQGIRRADQEARGRLRGRASTVFSAPIQAILGAADYREANEISRRVSGKGLTKQAFALIPKIREVAAAWSPNIFEAHPEVSFAAMAGRPLLSAKHSWHGMLERRHLLRSVGLDVPDDLGDAGTVAPDDVLDATAAAWTAGRIVARVATSLPSPPERFEEREVAIWY